MNFKLTKLPTLYFISTKKTTLHSQQQKDTPKCTGFNEVMQTDLVISDLLENHVSFPYNK